MDSESLLKQFGLEYQIRLNPQTIKDYQRHAKEFLEYVGMSIDAIKKVDSRNWLFYLTEKNYQPSTINNKLAGVKLFFQYCLEEGIILMNPVEEIPFMKLEEKIPYYLSKEQLAMLRGHLIGRKEERAIIEVLYATGIRISELVDMKRMDIKWSERLIMIPKGKRKRGRIVLFTRECEEHLKRYLDSRTDNFPYVFMNLKANAQKCPQVVGAWFRSYAKELDFKVTPHTLRHTFAAHLARKGMPFECIQLLLGHDDFKNTQVYARLYDHARKEIYDELM